MISNDSVYTRVRIAVVLASFFAFLGMNLAGLQAFQPKHSIKDVMSKAMTGGLLAKVAEGKGSDDDRQLLLELLGSLAANLPPEGDADDWKARTDALVEGAKGMIEKIPGSNDKLRAAAHCASCHKQHRPYMMAINDPDNIPVERGMAPQRRAFLIVSAIVILGIIGFGVWDTLTKMSVQPTCQSDRLSPLAYHLRQYAQTHDRRLPPVDQLLAVAEGEGIGNYHYGCHSMQLPFQWDLRLAGKRLDDIDQRALAWCPPGGHGSYVGVIVVEQGKLHARILTISELKARVGDYQAK